ncbi:BLUF domain-containing protein [Salinimicrobium xinjiangense]|uniref:BLUF domain-containing protein n=1 Tax=Salinimicrobium xinjiangense TaxID=438596 RepID=UPI00048F1FD1|nr:BLUF domain-containing protein [Salinimicrobium xinjiangense]
MRHAICYLSTASKDLDYLEVRQLLEFCAEKNRSLEIKGILLYSDGNFFQILEGEKEVVLEIFQKIEKDSRHHGIIQIIGRDIPTGSYDGYKVDILTDEKISTYEIPSEYSEALLGIPLDVRKTMERMLERFISTR